MQRRPAGPWSRLSLGLGLDHEATLVDLLETIADLGPAETNPEPTYTGQAASGTDANVRDLQFPQGSSDDTWPTMTLGVASVSTAAGSHWVPIHGSVVSADKLRVCVPAALPSILPDGATITIALGVPPAAITAAYLLAVTEQADTSVQSCGVVGHVPQYRRTADSSRARQKSSSSRRRSRTDSRTSDPTATKPGNTS